MQGMFGPPPTGGQGSQAAPKMPDLSALMNSMGGMMGPQTSQQPKVATSPT